MENKRFEITETAGSVKGFYVVVDKETQPSKWCRIDAIRLEEATAMGMCCASSHVRISSSPGFLGGGA